MRSLRFALAAACLLASTAYASPTDPKNGAEYVTLTAPQPTQATGKKVEVIEFFMYHCPHCNVLEPEMEAWVKRQGDNIAFKRIHFPSTGPLDPEAHLYLTLEAMGKADEFQPKVFKAVHVERLRLNTDDAIIAWAAKNGLDKAKFTDTWNSFGVLSKLKRLSSIVTAYKVDGAPTLIVDGKYMTSPSLVNATNPGTNEAVLSKMTMQVLDALVSKSKPAVAKK
ncbi:MAG: thiol:disulfide interchange protein DsbA/DsbL [Pseudomonadota bacterium]